MSHVGKLAHLNTPAGSCFVVIDSYDAASGICEVTQKFGPTEKKPEVNPSFTVTLKELITLYQEETFTEAISFAEVVPLSSFKGKTIPFGTIFDASDDGGIPANLLVRDEWWIKTSCRIVGSPYDAETFERISSGAAIRKTINIQLTNSTDIVEFENILFTGKDLPCAVFCHKGANICFRRCWFSGLKIGVHAVWDYESPGWDQSDMKIKFEECIFHDCTECCLSVIEAVTINLINCKFLDSSCALSATGEAVVTANFCKFLRLNDGWNCRDEEIYLRIFACVFRDIKESALLVHKTSNVHIRGCGATACGVFLNVAGPRLTTLRLDDCSVQKCPIGVIIMFGRMDAIFTDVRFTETETALHIGWDVIGNVDLVKTSSFRSPCKSPYTVLSGEKCFVTFNGKVIQPRSRAHIQEDITTERKTEDFDAGRLRMMKKAGVGNVTCFNCQKVEPPGITNKKCAQCKKVCYCSRACQVRLYDNIYYQRWHHFEFLTLLYFTESSLADAPTVLR